MLELMTRSRHVSFEKEARRPREGRLSAPHLRAAGRSPT